MKEQCLCNIEFNEPIARNIFLMIFTTNISCLPKPGQFVNIKVDGFYLRRPFSVCDFFDGSLAIIYKIVGNGTKKLSRMARNEQLDVIFGLGNGFNLNVAKNSRNVVLIGGGVGIPPLYFVAKNLKKADVNFRTVLGFTSSDQVFFSDKFSKFSEVTIVTADGKVGEKGLVTDILGKISYDYYFTCGPLPMLKAIHKMSTVPGQLLFESRMACGFGACAACSLKTLSGSKKICTEGPMIYSDEVDFS